MQNKVASSGADAACDNTFTTASFWYLPLVGVAAVERICFKCLTPAVVIPRQTVASNYLTGSTSTGVTAVSRTSRASFWASATSLELKVSCASSYCQLQIRLMKVNDLQLPSA